jgi:hypothetical protein
MAVAENNILDKLLATIEFQSLHLWLEMQICSNLFIFVTSFPPSYWCHFMLSTSKTIQNIKLQVHEDEISILVHFCSSTNIIFCFAAHGQGTARNPIKAAFFH